MIIVPGAPNKTLIPYCGALQGALAIELPSAASYASLQLHIGMPRSIYLTGKTPIFKYQYSNVNIHIRLFLFLFFASPEGVNGQLPNLDLINTITRVAASESSLAATFPSASPRLVATLPLLSSLCAALVTSLPTLLAALPAPLRDLVPCTPLGNHVTVWAAQGAARADVLAAAMLRQATGCHGAPNQVDIGDDGSAAVRRRGAMSHVFFLRNKVPAVTLRGVPGAGTSSSSAAVAADKFGPIARCESGMQTTVILIVRTK